MTDAPTAYPLAWPAVRPRTPAGQRQDAKFRSSTGPNRTSASKPVTLPDARARLADEIDLLRARYPVLSTNLELRADGQPRADRMQPADPGVAVYFQLAGKPIVLTCDRWTTVAGNIAAIAAHIGAMRGMDRWGVASVEQMFSGFQALPAPLVPGDWRTALGNPATLAEAEAAWLDRIRRAHPDAGGSQAEAAALNAAIATAREAFR